MRFSPIFSPFLYRVWFKLFELRSQAGRINYYFFHLLLAPILSGLVYVCNVKAEVGLLDEETVFEWLHRECGDTNEVDPIDRWFVLSCQESRIERWVNEKSIADDFGLQLINEIQIKRAFLEGLHEGEATCGYREEDDEFSDEDSYGDYFEEDDEEIVNEIEDDLITICYIVKPSKVGRTIAVPESSIDGLLAMGGYEGACDERDEKGFLKSAKPTSKKNSGIKARPGNTKKGTKGGKGVGQKVSKSPKKNSKKIIKVKSRKGSKSPAKGKKVLK